MYLPSKYRNYVAMAHDAVMTALSFVLALWLRLGDNFYLDEEQVMLGAGLFTVIAMTVFLSMRLYRGLWRYASLQDLVTLTKAVTLAILIFIPAMFLITRLEGLPRSLPFINWLLLLAMLGGPRFLYRMLKDGDLKGVLQPGNDRRIPVLLIGAGDNAELFLRESAHRASSQFRVVGIVEDDKSKIDRVMQGVRIHGDVSNIGRVIDKLERKGAKPRKLIVTEPRYKGEALRQLLQAAEQKGLTLARMPSVSELRHGVEDKTEVRPIAIEDLLGRAQMTLDREAMRQFISGKRVLLTGAGGTIGGELTRQVAAFGPAKLMLVEQSEYNLYRIDQEIAEDFPELDRESLLADVRDREHLEVIFRQEKPEVVFHAAAIKHVPLSEDNPGEAVLTNVFGTRNVAECCLQADVQAMVMISTDKAVNPSNVMGATKRVAESICQVLGDRARKTRFMTVRFGNVLGSTGSVVPLFKRQLEAGGPITVTDPHMVRYFMTVREAVELVLQASAYGAEQPPEKGGMIFVLDMGEPVKIEDLARQMIRLAGLEPEEDIRIVHTGLRPGEKLYEELFHYAEAPVKTEKEGVLLALPRPLEEKKQEKLLAKLSKAAQARKDRDVRVLLKELVPEYEEK